MQVCDQQKAEREASKAGSWNQFRSAMKGSKCDAATLGELWRNNKPSKVGGKGSAAKRQQRAKPTRKTAAVVRRAPLAVSVGCVEQTKGHYVKASRKATPFAAKDCVGEILEGKDGLYESREYGSKGHHRWVKLTEGETKPPKALAAKRATAKKQSKAKSKGTRVQFAEASVIESLPAGCEEKFTKHYQNRPSPPYPANRCCGMVLPNQDGTLYESRADKNGVCHWRKVKNASAVTMQAKLKRPAVRFALTSPEGALYSGAMEQSAPASSDYVALPIAAAYETMQLKPAVQYGQLPADIQYSQLPATNAQNAMAKDDERLLQMLQDFLDAAQQYGNVRLLTINNVAQLQANKKYKALFGQTYQYEEEPTKAAIGTIEVKTVKSDMDGKSGRGILFEDNGGEPFAATMSDLSQGLGYLCTGSGCDPIWLLVDKNNRPVQA